MPASSSASEVAVVGRSVEVIRHSQLLDLSGSRVVEVLEQVCLTRVDLASGQSAVHILGYRGRSSPRGSSGGELQACRRGGVCLKSSGGMLRACGRGGVCLKSSGACCGPGDVEMFASRAWEAHAGGLRTSRHGGMEAYCRRADVEAQRYGGLEVRCRRVASKRYGGVEA